MHEKTVTRGRGGRQPTSMIETDVRSANSSSAIRRGLLCTALLVGACIDSADLGDVPGETEGSSGTDGSSQESSTAGGQSESGGEGPRGTCEVVEGVPWATPSWSWALLCRSESIEGIDVLEMTASGDTLVAVHMSVDPGAPPTIWEVGDLEYVHSGLTNALLLRLDSEGQIEWSRHFSSEADGEVQLENIAECGDGFVISGDAGSNPVDYGEGTLEAGEFLARFDADGTFLWSRSFEVMLPDGRITMSDVHCDAAGNIAIAGGVGGGLDFGGGMVAAGLSDAFVAKYDPDGELVFGKVLLSDSTADPSGFAFAPGVALHDDGSVYTFLSVNSSVDFGDGPIAPANPGVAEQALLVRLSGNGDLLWSAPFEGEELVYAQELQVDAEGRVLASGLFLDTVEVGGNVFENAYPLDEQNPAEAYSFDAYIAVFEADGTYAWGESLGWTQDESASLGLFEGGEALVYRISERQTSVSTYSVDGSAELFGIEFEPPTTAETYSLMGASEGGVVLGGSMGDELYWPIDLSDYGSGRGDAIVVHVGL